MPPTVHFRMMFEQDTRFLVLTTRDFFGGGLELLGGSPERFSGSPERHQAPDLV
jgi:hypothetical protein